MSSDSEIGAEVEKELEEKVDPPAQKKSRTFSNRLTTAEKFRLLEQWKQGKVDKYYNVYPDKKKEGEFRFIKRRKPLDMPDDNQVMSVKTSEAPEKVDPPPAPPSTQQVIQEPKQFPTEFFQFQSNVNTSLQRELESLQEKYTKLSDKLDKQSKENPKKVVSKPRSKAKEEPKKRKKSTNTSTNMNM